MDETTEAPEVECIGDMDFDSADDANVPVDIWLTEEKDNDDTPTGYWRLKATNYMPRKGRLGDDFVVRSKDLKALQRIIQEQIAPLYRIAAQRVAEMASASPEVVRSETAPHLYYWQ